jgi:hypothetical protein
MSEPSEYTHDHLAPDRDLHRENLEQEEREITRRTSALAYTPRHYEHRHALYWSDVVTDLLDDCDEVPSSRAGSLRLARPDGNPGRTTLGRP